MPNYGVRAFYGITIVLICRRDTPRLASAIHCLLRGARGRLDSFKTTIHPKPHKMQSREKQVALPSSLGLKNVGAVETRPPYPHPRRPRDSYSCGRDFRGESLLQERPSRSCSKRSPTKIPSTRLAAPRSPRMPYSHQLAED